MPRKTTTTSASSASSPDSPPGASSAWTTRPRTVRSSGRCWRAWASMCAWLRAGLEEALLIGDVSASNTAVDGIDAQDPELGAELRRAVREYRFDDFLGLLGRLT